MLQDRRPSTDDEEGILGWSYIVSDDDYVGSCGEKFVKNGTS
jgi:hypothetical protein